ncbi:MAG: hypothetical protein M3N46_00775 [Actinomycetota bacterium]|nr:hypothetical protein [Actinomycetota bacterium]
MHIVDDPEWRRRFTLTGSALTSGERNLLARAASSGSVVRIARGVYADGKVRRSHDETYRDLVHARELVSPTALVFSHTSAAALWRIPRIGPWPARIHVTSAQTAGRTTPHFVRHTGGSALAPDTIDGVQVTALARTVVDLARTESTTNAVLAADASMAGIVLGDRTFVIPRDDLVREVDLIGSGRGVRSARFVVDFANPLSGSPGETRSRISIARAGLTPPILQQCFEDEEGRMFVDFWWPELGVAGEFDGEGKYRRSEFTGGRSAADVVVDEKKREDRLRRQVSTVARWGWEVAGSPLQLGALLRAAGVK